MKIPSFIQSLLIRLLGAFNLALHAALESVHNLQISDALQQLAHDAVIAAEQAGGTGADKFNAAVAAVEKAGLSFAKGAIQTAVQNAWGSLFGTTQTLPK
jgi:hypothetical protein